MKGTTSSATKSETKSTIEMPHGKKSKKSWNIPVMVSNSGKNVMEMANVAERMDLKKCVALRKDACQRVYPSDINSI